MNIKIFLAGQTEPEKFEQQNVGPEEYVACELIAGWVIISDRWGYRTIYPSHVVTKIKTGVTHEDRGS